MVNIRNHLVYNSEGYNFLLIVFFFNLCRHTVIKMTISFKKATILILLTDVFSRGTYGERLTSQLFE